MTTMIKLPGEKWWIELDSTTNEIIASWYKPQVIADITSIQESLLLYPDVTQDATDVVSIGNAIDNTSWTANRKTRCKALVQTMYQAYQGGTANLEAVQLLNKLATLKEVLARLVV